MIHYIIQVVLFQILFLAVYDFFLSKETFFTKNRWYLLGTMGVSFLMPIIKIPTLQKVLPKEMTFSFVDFVDMSVNESMMIETSWLERLSTVEIVFFVGVLLFSLLFFIKLIKVFWMINNHQKIIKMKFTLVLLVQQTKAFSFFNYIFLGKDIPKEKQEKIIAHELIHSQQKHTVDLLFFELLRIIMWFNPMIYVYQKRITLVHEYISDAAVVQSTTKEHYINNLLSDVFQVENISFVNQFYKHSFIKKRIIMMTKSKSNQLKQLKYLLLVPVIAMMLLYTSCEDTYVEDQKLQEKQKDTQQINKMEIEGSVSFPIVDTPPVFPGCTGLKKELKACFSEGVVKHFVANFDANLPNQLGLSSGKKRVFIGFKIDKEGNVVNIQCRAPHPKIKNEVVRIMKSLPKMIPGEHQGKKVVVKYVIPFTIIIGNQDDGDEIIYENQDNQDISKEEASFIVKESIETINKKLRNGSSYVDRNIVTETVYEETSTEVSFMLIEKVPVFPGCTGTNLEKKKCFSKEIQKHFGTNFNGNLPSQLGLAAGKKRVFIGFKIDKEGNVVNIQCRAPHPAIKKEVVRIMENLPKMTPGEQRGKKVDVRYSIPFVIIVE